MSSAQAAARSSFTRASVGRIVVVGLEVAAHGLEDRRGLLVPGRVDELVRPDRLAPELGAVRIDALLEEPPAPLGALERAHDGGGGVVPNAALELRRRP